MRRYSKSHEWIDAEPGGLATVGATRHLWGRAAPLSAVRLPAPGKKVSLGGIVATIVTAAGERPCYSPASGRIEELNPRLKDSARLLEEDPEGEGWLFRMVLSRPFELEVLSDPEAYFRFLFDADLIS